MDSQKIVSITVKTGRKPYIKPRIEAVELRPKETMLGSCRSQSIISNQGSAFPCNMAVICRQDY